jgi:hypothetical protein
MLQPNQKALLTGGVLKRCAHTVSFILLVLHVLPLVAVQQLTHNGVLLDVEDDNHVVDLGIVVKSHGCYSGGMGGLSFEGNRFVCRAVGRIVASTERATSREGMLACPEGFFMTALNIGRNLLRCGRTDNAVSQPALVHAQSNGNGITQCPGSSVTMAAVMVGFHYERRTMLCATVRRGDDPFAKHPFAK